jgi:hypothetical protein
VHIYCGRQVGPRNGWSRDLGLDNGSYLSDVCTVVVKGTCSFLPCSNFSSQASWIGEGKIKEKINLNF